MAQTKHIDPPRKRGRPRKIKADDPLTDTAKTEPAKTGRPPKLIDFDLVNEYISYGHTGAEIAQFLRLDYDTLNKRLKEQFGVGFADYYKQQNFHFKSRLRSALFRTAIGQFDADRNKWVLYPNPALLIFLAKNHLSMTDNGMVDDDVADNVQIVYERQPEPAEPETIDDILRGDND